MNSFSQEFELGMWKDLPGGGQGQRAARKGLQTVTMRSQSHSSPQLSYNSSPKLYSNACAWFPRGSISYKAICTLLITTPFTWISLRQTLACNQNHSKWKKCLTRVSICIQKAREAWWLLSPGIIRWAPLCATQSYTTRTGCMRWNNFLRRVV